MDIKKVLIVGSGSMGGGIAQLCAQKGIEAIITDINLEVAEKGKARLEKGLSKRVEKGKITEADKEDVLSRISVAGDLSPASDVDIVIESAVEDLEVKKKIFAELFEGKVHALSFHFLNLLLEKNRESLLPEIIRLFLAILDESRGIVRCQLLTACPFTDIQLASLKNRLDRIIGKNVVLEQSVDEQLLGGFVVRMDDRVIDNSIINQLSQLRESLIFKD